MYLWLQKIVSFETKILVINKRQHFACSHSIALIIENPLTGLPDLKRNVIGKDRSLLKYSFYEIFRFLCEEH